MPIFCDRFCSVKYVNQFSKDTVILYSTYLPTSGNDDLFLETLETLNFDILQNKRTSDTLILASDTNVSEKSTKRRLNAFKNFKDAHKIVSIMNSSVPTFHHNNQTSESQLDHIYVSSQISGKISLSFSRLLCLKENASNLSSHDVIVARLNLPVNKLSSESNKHGATSYTSFKVRKPNWSNIDKEKYQIQTADFTKELFSNYAFDDDLIPELCEMFSRTLVMCAESQCEAEPQNSLTVHTKPKHKKYPYFSIEYRAAHKALKLASEQWRKAY